MLGKQTNKQKPNRSKINKQTPNQPNKETKQEEHRKLWGWSWLES